MTEHTKMPVENEDMKAGILAAFKRIESVRVTANLIDLMPDDEWHSEDPDHWCINVGSDAGGDEADSLDHDVVCAA